MLRAVDGAQGTSECRFPAGFLGHGLHHGPDNPCDRLLESRSALFGQVCEPVPRAHELVLENGLGMAVERAVSVVHRAATAGVGAGSDARAGFRVCEVNVKPQNMRAIPISSPR